MNQLSEDIGIETSVNAGHRFAAIGLFLSILAFTLSVTTPWVYEKFAPPSISIEDIAIEKVLSIKDKLIAKVTGKTISVKDVIEAPEHWTDHWFIIVISISLGGIICAMVGLLQRENNAVIIAASLFGLSAIVMQYTLLALGLIILCILIAGILGTFGISF